MEYNCLIVRSYEDRRSDTLFPIAEKATKTVVLTPADGTDTKRTFGTDWHHSNGSFGLDTRVEIIVTDVRVAICIPRYKKGGGWTGGILGLLMNIPSYAIAAYRHSRNAMVGHLYYPWISIVGLSTSFSVMRGRPQHDELQLEYLVTDDDDPVRAGVTISLNSGVDGLAVANEILRRACRHRLMYRPDLDEEQRTILHNLGDTGITRPVEKDSVSQAIIPASVLPGIGTIPLKPNI